MQASRGVWAAEATYPPSTDLTLSSERLPWTIWVKSNVHETVHVADVLRCIYRSLQTPVTDEEFAALDAGRSFHVHAAYRARCHRCQTPKEYEEEKKVGVRRIDFLMGRHMFAGLSASLRDRASGTWILHIL
ncbi:hypothetical protein GLOTRDRAFT_49760 [Gloeophyllum trabeum ATCC 11539]|uniref:DUF6699 domain-containing protein n=1 Tax=Gloeophyllum trabeum (strain ATCC 11539 / FP-39264 / Madison 617) TaxID=670483 RepID=S7PTW6_GLOTA|nr:uncharacterized protein GLOTRDRAFT_49760 [Gloeophyllum trabeum ATCC 11539]EPQ50883.1 hypothetical protein GLOTRDRAFT_49760 [Gloeophyllum trabeum ATCC 11539]